MRCTLVINDWEMRDDFFDYLKSNTEPTLDLNDKLCPIDNMMFKFRDGESDILLECHYDKSLTAN